MAVVLALKHLFDLREELLKLDSWLRGSDLGLKTCRYANFATKAKVLTGLNEGRAKGDNSVVLESDVGNGVGERNTVLQKR